jgi:hypothetical protein
MRRSVRAVLHIAAMIRQVTPELAQDLSLGILTTQLPRSSANGVGYATVLFARLTAYLSPDHKVEIPGL